MLSERTLAHFKLAIKVNKIYINTITLS